jgi:pyruvate decarboxylase
LDTAEFAEADKIQIVEVMMEMHDAPRALKVQLEMGRGKPDMYTPV